MDLSQLLEARLGRPTESQAARKIATFAVIPAAMAGLLGGTRLVGMGEPTERFVLVCVAMACGAGFGVGYLVLALYAAFGFRPVSILADALVGGFVGLLGGACLTMITLWFKLLPLRYALWPLLLIAFGAAIAPFLLPNRDGLGTGESSRQPRDATERSGKSTLPPP